MEDEKAILPMTYTQSLYDKKARGHQLLDILVKDKGYDRNHVYNRKLKAHFSQMSTEAEVDRAIERLSVLLAGRKVKNIKYNRYKLTTGRLFKTLKVQWQQGAKIRICRCPSCPPNRGNVDIKVMSWSKYLLRRYVHFWLNLV